MPEWKKVYWEDVTDGQDIGFYEMQIDAVKISCGAWATRDSNPIHHDKAFAERANTKNIIVNIMHSEGILCRLATDWSGPTGELKRTRFNIRGSCIADDTMKVVGKVIKKYVGQEDNYMKGLHLVDLQIDATANGNPFCDAQITLALPTKRAHS
jgi:acyl dehydratase